MTAATQGRTDRARAGTLAASGMPAGDSIAVVTAIPSVIEKLCGLDAYGLNRRTVSRLDMSAFLSKHGIADLDIDLFFVPSLIDEWSQYDDGYSQQLVNALVRGTKQYSRVINIGQAVPLYRRYRPGAYPTKAALMNSAVTFANTLSMLATLPIVLNHRVLEPKAFDRTTYAFNTNQYGEMSIVDMEVKSEWITGDSDIWSDAPTIGLDDLSALEVPEISRAAAGDCTTMGEWIDSLRMMPLANRFIYSDFKLDYDDQTEQLWIENERLPDEEKFLLNTDDVFANSRRVLSERRTSEGEALSKDEIAAPEIANAFAALSQVIGSDDDLRMLDIAGLLDLNDDGVPQNPGDYGRAARVLLKKFPFSVAFQKMWDRQAKLYKEDELNGKVNAWHVANTLLHLKSEMKTSLPPFVVWAIPVMPTNSVRFIIDPKAHSDNIEKTLINAFTTLAEQERVSVVSR